MPQYSYRPQMNRNVTRKWAEARQVDYDGDDWGDDSYDEPAEPTQPALTQAGRSFTNPPSINTNHRLSFDQGPEQRVFSAGAAGPRSGFPSANQPASSQFAPSQPAFQRDPTQPRPLEPAARTSIDSLRTSAPSSQAPAAATGLRSFIPASLFSRNQDQTRTSEPTGRTSIESQGRSGLLPDVTSSTTGTRAFPQTQQTLSRDQFQSRTPEPSGRGSMDSFRTAGSSSQVPAPVVETRAFPPRKSSLSQPDVPNFAAATPTQSSVQPSTQANDKPLALPRPSDIYRRMDEEKEKERRSQESSRPSLDSVRREVTEATPQQKTNLDTVPERKSEYGMAGLTSAPDTQSIARSSSPSQINTNVSQEKSFPSASSLYTDRPDSLATDSQLPSRNVSQHDSNIGLTRPTLPLVTRTSTFGPDIFRSTGILLDTSATSRQPAQSAQQTSANEPLRQETTSNAPYRNLVQSAFQSENTRGSPVDTEDSLLRSNTTSTSQISPIVGRRAEPEWDTGLARNVEQANEHENQRSNEEMVEDLGTPRRLGTNRRDSPSPARRPTNVVAPSVSEPQSAILSPSGDITKDTATEAQILRPGPAVIVHQKGLSTESVPRAEKSGISGVSGTAPTLRNKESHMSEVSDLSTMRTASEEWRDWSKQRKEFNAKHGFMDSNPTTPGIDSSGMSSPAPQFASLDKSVSAQPSNLSDDTLRGAPTTSSQSASARPLMGREESFRPSLPGGWESSNSIQRPGPLNVTATNPRHDTPTRSDSVESIPTAGPPREADWRSQYTGPQAQAFTNARNAGTALAGIFNGPALTSRGGDSEVSSINEGEDNPAGRNRDSTLFVRDFGSSSPPPPAFPDQYATRDFANVSSPAHETSQTTPKAAQQPFAATRGSTRSAKSTSSHPRIARLAADEGRGHSPSRESERWWSDEEDDDEATAAAHAPTPLRTKRLSTVDSHERNSPSLSHPPRFDSHSHDPDQLESDIMRSLTPKSSSVGHQNRLDLGHGPQLSPTRTNENRAGSPPFSAAALALSPARRQSALQEQNTFKPLVDPDTSTMQNVPGETLRDSTSTNPNTPPRGFTLTGRGPNSAVASQTQSARPTSSHADSTRDVQGAPQISQPTRSSTKEFTIMPDEHDAPTVSPTSVNNQQHAQPLKPSPLSDELNDTTDEPRASGSTHLPAVIAAERAIPKSVIEIAAERAVPRSVSESQPTPSTFDQGATLPRSNELSNTTTSNPMSVGGPVKNTLDPVVTPNDRSPRRSISRSVSHDSVSAPSPIIPPSGQAPRSTTYEAHRSFPVDKVPVEKIFGMGSAQQRIQAYNENREVYAQPVGHLENWLSHMNSTDNADAFTALPRSKTELGTPNSKVRRDDSTPSGPKQIQEDGKKLLASASKMGAKAGILGKGLFSKGKEKLRTVSASQKGGSTSRKTADMPEYNRSVSATSTNAPPQLPTPTMATPIEAFGAYFPPGERSRTPPPTTRAAVAPPFSPISEVSTNPNELGRSVSAVSEDQSPQSNTTARQIGPTVAATQTPTATRDADKRKSGGTVSALESEREGRVSADLLNPSGATHDRVNSSVSDVSSVSDSLDHRRNHAARTISPPIEHQVSRDDAPSVSPLPGSQVANKGTDNQRSQHAPSYSTAMASKEAEATNDRTEEQTLPAYSQPDQTKSSKIPQGTPIVPIARLRQDQDVRAEEPRPFSFVGHDSLLHTGHETNHSIDNPGVNIGSTVPDGRPQGDQQNNIMSGGITQPTPVNSQPGDRSGPAQPSRIVTQAQAEEGYRIPGPYGHELRSPRPKNTSPMAEHFKHPAMPQGPADILASGAVPQRSVTSEYTPFPPQTNTQQTSQPASQVQQQPYTSSNTAAVRPGMSQEYSEGSSRPDARPSGDRDRYREDSRDRDYSRDRSRDRDYSRDRSRDRGPMSKLTAFFGGQSRSRSRPTEKEESRKQRPDNSRRNSLFKQLAGGRASMSRDESYNKTPTRPQDEDYTPTSETTAQNSSRPTGVRRLSRDLFRSNDSSEMDVSNMSPIAHGFATAHKRKRLSSLFGRSQTQVPTRASTAPLTDQQQSELDPMYGPERPEERKRVPNTSRHVSFEQGPTPQRPTSGPRTRDYFDQTTPSQNLEGPGRRSTDNYRQYSNDRNQTQSGPSLSAGPHGPARQNTGPSDYFDPYNNWLLAQKAANNEQPDQYSLLSNTPYSKPPQAGSPYQHENRPYAHDNANQYQYDQARPVLPRLNTGDNRSASGTPVPASAPPVPSSYMQARQNENAAPIHTRTLPQSASQQQYQQMSFPQPPSLSQYHQPPTTRAARDISHNSDVHDRTNTALLNTSQNNDYNDRQMASPLPISPVFSEPNAFNQPMSGAVGPTSTYARANENPSMQPISAYNHPPTSRITPHVAQLHVRSRSPKLGRRSSDDLKHEFETTGNSLSVNAPQSASSMSPVAGLGTFSNKKVSPLGGIPRRSEEQEKPWAITLPADEEERRRRADDPQSATSSKAREMRRIMLERSPAATPGNATQAPMGQTVADRFESHGLPQQTTRTGHQPLSSLPVAAQQSRIHEHEPSTPALRGVSQQSENLDNTPTVPARPGPRTSQVSDQETPLPAMPGTQQVSPPSRKNTPITIGRPTTPSFSLRRDVSLRGKGARTSTVIDEAGRAAIVSGLAKRDTTPMGGHGTGRESLDIGGPSRSSTWGSRDITPQHHSHGSRDITPQHHMHESTIPGRGPAMTTANMPGESRSMVPPVPNIPSTLNEQPTPTEQYSDPSAGRSGSSFMPNVASTAGTSGTADPFMTRDTNPLIKDQSLLNRDPVIPTTTNMAAPSTSTGLHSGAAETNPLIKDSNLVTRDPIIPTTTNMPATSMSTGPDSSHRSSHRDIDTRDERPIIPTTTNMMTAPTPRDPESMSTDTNMNSLIKDQSLVTRDPIIPTTTNMPGAFDSPSTSTNPFHDRDHKSASLPTNTETNPLIKDQSLAHRDPIIPTTTNTNTNTNTNMPVATNTNTNVPGTSPSLPTSTDPSVNTNPKSTTTSNLTTNNRALKPLEVYEMMGSRPDGYESEDEPFMSATAYPGQEWQPVFESWED